MLTLFTNVLDSTYSLVLRTAVVSALDVSEENDMEESSRTELDSHANMPVLQWQHLYKSRALRPRQSTLALKRATPPTTRQRIHDGNRSRKRPTRCRGTGRFRFRACTRSSARATRKRTSEPTSAPYSRSLIQRDQDSGKYKIF
jgi:hypothetical protein